MVYIKVGLVRERLPCPYSSLAKLRLLDEDAQNSAPTPIASLGDHTLPITDIACGMGVFPNCRILTASVDYSVKLWDLATQTLLTSWLLPSPIARIAWDPTERLFFAAADGAKGDVYQVNLFRRRDDGRGEAVGGAGVADIVRISDDETKESSQRIINVGSVPTYPHRQATSC